MANGGLTSFVRPLPRILENNARYLLFQYTWEEEWSRLAGVRYMLLWTLQICLLTSQQQLTQMTTLSSTGSTSLASWRLNRCSPPFLDIPSQGHLQSPILLPFLRMSLFLRVLPMESFSFFILSLEDLLYLLAYKRPNLFLSFRLIQYTHVLPSWLNIP